MSLPPPTSTPRARLPAERQNHAFVALAERCRRGYRSHPQVINTSLKVMLDVHRLDGHGGKVDRTDAVSLGLPHERGGERRARLQHAEEVVHRQLEFELTLRDRLRNEEHRAQAPL